MRANGCPWDAGTCQWAAVGGNLATLFQEHAIAKKSLVTTLIQFYVDIEIMGREFDGARMFYSKFAYRHYMAELLLYVTKHDSYIKSLEQVVSDDPDAFVRFINMMLNDVIFCLDDAILKLQDIRSTETLMADHAQWNALNDEQRKEKKEELDQKYDQAHWGLRSGNEILDMMKMLTLHTVAPFLRSLPRLRSSLPTRPPPTSQRSAADAPWPCTVALHLGPAP